MTGKVTDRFNEIALFGMAFIFWQKAIKFFTKFIIDFLTYRVERLPHFLGLAPLLGLAPPPIRLQILISALVRVSAHPSDKCLLQISLDFDQDGEPELFLNQLTSASLGLSFLLNILSNTCMLYKK